jgi:glycosyltransferase involved in cell wall biosynthesis
MNILYIHQYFKSPQEPGGTRSYWVAQELISRGHEVTIITQNKKAKQNIELKIVDGIQVIYIKNWYANSMSISARLKSFFSFMWKSSILALKQKNIDLVIATSTPLSVGLPALLMKFFHRVPFIFEVRDLWPEVPIQMGALKNPISRKFAIYFEKVIYKNAKHIVALSPGIFNGVAKHVSENKITIIPNMAKNDKFWPREKNNALIKKLGLKQNSFKIIYFGSMGIANGLLYIMEAAKIINNTDDIEFIFLGEGKSRAKCEEYAQKNQLRNVHFFERVAMDLTSEIVNFCDVSIVPFLNLPILATNSPNKLFDSLSAAKPIIVNSNGWTRKIVEDNKCGAYVNPEKPEELANIIIEWKNNPKLLSEMGNNGRLLAQNEYDKSILTKKFADIISEHFK